MPLPSLRSSVEAANCRRRPLRTAIRFPLAPFTGTVKNSSEMTLTSYLRWPWRRIPSEVEPFDELDTPWSIDTGIHCHAVGRRTGWSWSKGRWPSSSSTKTVAVVAAKATGRHARIRVALRCARLKPGRDRASIGLQRATTGRCLTKFLGLPALTWAEKRLELPACSCALTRAHRSDELQLNGDRAAVRSGSCLPRAIHLESFLVDGSTPLVRHEHVVWARRDSRSRSQKRPSAPVIGRHARAPVPRTSMRTRMAVRSPVMSESNTWPNRVDECLEPLVGDTTHKDKE